MNKPSAAAAIAIMTLTACSAEDNTATSTPSDDDATVNEMTDDALEAAPETEPTFDVIDADFDEYLTFEELLTVIPDLTEDQFNVSDQDGDGNIDEEEFEAMKG